MTSIRRLCARPDFSPAELQRGAAWMLGASIGLSLLGLGLIRTFGQSAPSQAVLYAAFPMALVLSGRSTYLEAYSRPVRWILLGGALAGTYLFMLAVAYLAESL